MFTNTRESGLEALIVKYLVEQNGYEEGIMPITTRNMRLMKAGFFVFCRIPSPHRWANWVYFNLSKKSGSF